MVLPIRRPDIGAPTKKISRKNGRKARPEERSQVTVAALLEGDRRRTASGPTSSSCRDRRWLAATAAATATPHCVAAPSPTLDD